MDKIQIKLSGDGSHTLYVPNLNETYHSIHGAIQEAKHVFIAAGLMYFKKKELSILEIGFGTGLNSFLTLLEVVELNKEVNYTVIENYPLELSIIKQLNYTNNLKSTSEEIKWYHLLHEVEWERYQKITSNYHLKKLEVDLDNYQTDEQFDLVYFDAFGPTVQPEMWTVAVFEKMYDLLVNGGVLVTYCAKGSVKRALKKIGFTVESLPGPPGKREITRAVKKIND
jgi:tRNA U34 5-methylaminomethyl-2-thiouridine-forming methyltransferase MnmC